MSIFFGVLSFLCLVLMFVGLVKPQILKLDSRKKVFFRLGGLFVTLFFVALIIPSGPKQSANNEELKTQTSKSEGDPASSKPIAEPTWNNIKSWTGTGAKKTELFTITGKQWRIKWSNTDTSGFGATSFAVMVYKPDSNLPVELLSNSSGTNSDISYSYKTGEFYLDVNAANGKWSIELEELN